MDPTRGVAFPGIGAEPGLLSKTTLSFISVPEGYIYDTTKYLLRLQATVVSVEVN
jgi:hypothetical protein